MTYSKFRAVKTECGAEHLHDSKAEAQRCDELRDMEMRGEITHLVQQPEFRYEIDGKLMFRYIADFQYRMADSGLPITLDVKGVTTPVFNLKRKIIEAAHPGLVVTIWPPRKRRKRKAKVP